MITRIKYSYINAFLLFIFIFIFSALSANADNALSAVNVKQVNNDSYNIILKVDNAVNIKKVSDSKDNLTLILNSAVPADSVEIVYDNTSDLKNVIVQKKKTDNTMILLQGKNIENAKVYTKELSTGLLKQVDSDVNSLNNYLYISNKKYLAMGLSAVIMFFILMLSFRPKSEKYMPVNKTKKQTAGNTLRSRVTAQKRYVPSINYRINTPKTNMTVPRDFIISDSQRYEEEKIRKAG